MFDLVIKDGLIFDGTGAPRVRGDVGIAGGVVTAMGRVDHSDAAQVIDARGMHVAPGFVDLHTHYDAQVFWDPYCTLSGWHGITSVAIGNCGFGFAPVEPDMREYAMKSMTRVEAIPYESMRLGMPWDWITFPEYLDSVERTPRRSNPAAGAGGPDAGGGAGPRRRQGRPHADRRRARPAGQDAARGPRRRRVRVDGPAAAPHRPGRRAAGLGRHADANRHRCRERGIPVYGQGVTSDAGFTYTLEDWNLYDDSEAWMEATTGTVEERLHKLADPGRRRALKDKMPSVATAPIDSVTVLGPRTPETEPYREMSVGQVAQLTGKHPVDAMLDIAVADKLQTLFFVSPPQGGSDLLKEIVQYPHMLFGVSDGGAHTKFLTAGRYPTETLTQQVRDNQWITYEDAHRRLAALPAQLAGFQDRGLLRTGGPADVVVYDPESLSIGPSEVVHDLPGGEWRRIQKASGYHAVIVNGLQTIADDTQTEQHSGKLLRYGRG